MKKTINMFFATRIGEQILKSLINSGKIITFDGTFDRTE